MKTKKLIVLSIVPALIIEILYLNGCILHRIGIKELFSILAMRHTDYFLMILPFYLLVINHIWYPERLLKKLFRNCIMVIILESVVVVHILGMLIMAPTQFDDMAILIIEIWSVLLILIVVVGWWISIGVRELLHVIRKKVHDL